MQVREKVGKSRFTMNINIYIHIYMWKNVNIQTHEKALCETREGMLEVTLPTIWRDGRAEMGRVREKKQKQRREGSEERRFKCAKKGRNICVFSPWFVALEGRKCKKLTVGPLFDVQMSKSARRCRTKHISKSKVSKTDRFGSLFDVQMSKKCTPFWPEAHFQVKSVKNWQVRTAFWRSDVEKVHTN